MGGWRALRLYFRVAALRLNFRVALRLCEGRENYEQTTPFEVVNPARDNSGLAVWLRVLLINDNFGWSTRPSSTQGRATQTP